MTVYILQLVDEDYQHTFGVYTKLVTAKKLGLELAKAREDSATYIIEEFILDEEPVRYNEVDWRLDSSDPKPHWKEL